MAIAKPGKVRKRPPKRSVLAPELRNKTLRDACKRVHWILGDAQTSEDVVVGAALDVAETSRQMKANRRRSDRNESDEPRESYRPYLDDHQIFHLLVMAQCEIEELDQEQAGLHLGEIDRIKRLVKHQVKMAMRHPSFDAGTSRCRIFGNYRASEFLDMYRVVAPNRVDTKDEPECSRTRDRLLRAIAKRFVVRPEAILDDERAETLPPADWRVSLIKETYSGFLPSNSGFEIPKGYKWKEADSPLLPFDEADPRGGLDRTCLFLDNTQLNRLAEACQLDHSEKRMRKLSLFTPDGPSSDHDARRDRNQAPQFDLNRIRARIAKMAERRRRLAPGSLSIRVDGVERGIVSNSEGSCAMLLDEDASVVQIVGKDNEGEIVVASYILTYDEPKTEVWKIKLPWSAEIFCTFEFDDNDCVRAELKLTRPGHSATCVIEKFSVVRLADLIVDRLKETNDSVNDGVFVRIVTTSLCNVKSLRETKDIDYLKLAKASELAERRSSPRYTMLLPLTLYLKGPDGAVERQGQTRDVRLHGPYFVIAGELEAGAPIECVLTLPKEITMTEDVKIRCYGRVLHVDSQNETVSASNLHLGEAGATGGTRGIRTQVEPYRFEPDKKPFHVKGIYHDAKFTYIKGQPEETTTLYEIVDEPILGDLEELGRKTWKEILIVIIWRWLLVPTGLTTIIRKFRI